MAVYNDIGAKSALVSMSIVQTSRSTGAGIYRRFARSAACRQGANGYKSASRAHVRSWPLTFVLGASKVWSQIGSTADKLRRRVLLAPQRLAHLGHCA